MKVYLVLEWDDRETSYSHWVDVIFLNREKAMEYMIEGNERMASPERQGLYCEEWKVKE